jgi:hypothetical protein
MLVMIFHSRIELMAANDRRFAAVPVFEKRSARQLKPIRMLMNNLAIKNPII